MRARVRLLGEPLLVVPFVAGAASIASLLGYFYGLFSMRAGVGFVLLPGLIVGVAFVFAARRLGRPGLADRILAGTFAGGIATLAYDVCRVPLVYSGLPIFKAITYFGSLVLDVQQITAGAELVGWIYHYSNGVGFAVMYAALSVRDRVWTAIAWGVFLETTMLLTPYAEVFGYTRGPQFVAITLGSHVVYGFGLWAGLHIWSTLRTPRRLVAGFAVPVLGVGLVGADFHRLCADALPSPPPAMLDDHLYTTWNVLEVDRVVTLWLVKRFHDRDATFALVQPFTKTPYGNPIDVPEAIIRRSGGKSAAEVALDEYSLRTTPGLSHMGEIATHFEITPWMVPPPGAAELGAELRDIAAGCGPAPNTGCLTTLFAYLDEWYRRETERGG